VAAGERIGVDGRVAAGLSDVDQALVSGESVPGAVHPGSLVHAGTVNLTAPLTLLTTASGEGTLLAEIVRLMEAAEQGRARLVALADRVARIYAPVVHVAALATFLGWWLLLAAPWQAAMMHAVAVLIITCPCALGLAVPVVQVVAGGRLMRRGVLLKSATALERLAQVDTVVFDKTGTRALPACLSARGNPGRMGACCVLGGHSRHPLARAAAAAHARRRPGLDDAVERPGDGMEGRLGDQVVRLAGVTSSVASRARPMARARSGSGSARTPPDSASTTRSGDAADTVALLKARGLRVLLLSGDRPEAVRRAAFAAGIDDWRAGCRPADKAAVLSDLAATGHRVLMVGDGINDAPALASAFVSMSPANAADISQAAATSAATAPVATTVEVARVACRIIRQKLGDACQPGAGRHPGFVTPLIAAIAMSSSAALVTGNAPSRCRRRTTPRRRESPAPAPWSARRPAHDPIPAAFGLAPPARGVLCRSAPVRR
jgi:Cu2+-exporting ATPase